MDDTLSFTKTSTSTPRQAEVVKIERKSYRMGLLTYCLATKPKRSGLPYITYLEAN